MDIVVVFAILTFVIFSVLVVNAKRNGVEILQNIGDNLIFSFEMAFATILSLSLIAYALFEKLIFGVTDDFLRLGILVGGAALLLSELKTIYNKFKKNKT